MSEKISAEGGDGSETSAVDDQKLRRPAASAAGLLNFFGKGSSKSVSIIA